MFDYFYYKLVKIITQYIPILHMQWVFRNTQLHSKSSFSQLCHFGELKLKFLRNVIPINDEKLSIPMICHKVTKLHFRRFSVPFQMCILICLVSKLFANLNVWFYSSSSALILVHQRKQLNLIIRTASSKISSILIYFK